MLSLILRTRTRKLLSAMWVSGILWVLGIAVGSAQELAATDIITVRESLTPADFPLTLTIPITAVPVGGIPRGGGRCPLM